MSGLEKILAEIQNDANEAAKSQIETAKKKADEISENTSKEIAKATAEYEHKNKLEGEHILERAKSAAELESRKLLLNKKQELITKALTAAKSKLETLSADEYFQTLQKLLNAYKTDDKGIMKLSKSDLKRLPADFEKGLPPQIKLSKESADIKNGFLLIYEGIDINCSFDALFEDKAEQLQDKAASILFN